MKKNSKFKGIVAYVLYPISFVIIASLLWALAGEPVYQKIDHEIRILLTDNLPE